MSDAFKLKVLFLCGHNSARSQMAEAFLRAQAEEQYEVYSAGLDARGIHPLTIMVMQEVGVSLTGQTSKSLRRYIGNLSFDYTISVCSLNESHCVLKWPAARETLYWPFDDPSGQEGTEAEMLENFRLVRDQIGERVSQWLRSRASSTGIE
jgi:arsenate reductase